MQYINQEFLNKMETLKEKEMLEALTDEFKTMFPRRTRVLGVENMNLFLTHQQKRSKYYGYIYYDDLKHYTLIAFYLGTYFDEDPFYFWVQEILEKDDSFWRRVDLLKQRFYEIFDLTIGKDAIYFQNAFRKLELVNKENIRMYRNPEQIVDMLTKIYPQRMKIIGQEVFYQSLKQQKLELVRFNIHNSLGGTIYAIIVFILGSYVYKDPLYSWVNKYLKQSVSTQEKVDILFERGLNRVRKELISIERILRKEKN